MFIFSNYHAFNADMYTPVSLYMQMRNLYPNSCLLESNEYNNRNNSKSIIGLDPLVEIILKDSEFKIFTPYSTEKEKIVKLNHELSATNQLEQIMNEYSINKENSLNGFYGRFGFEFSHYSEKITASPVSKLDLPEVHLFLFRYLIVLDHFNSEGHIIENSFDEIPYNKARMENLLHNKPYTLLSFQTTGEEKSESTDTEFLSGLASAHQSILRGDVFQIVLSKRYFQNYIGDDFEVYRNLRRLNPSPYLFYFDFGNYRLFGSSPEAQLIINKKEAIIHPIAGTVKKSGDLEKDKIAVEFLIGDEKENSEHTMLVDLARNDLSKYCNEVKITKFKELQEFSHVFHLVSEVKAMTNGKDNLSLFNHCLPAGTLSGTPKPKALELIAKLEPVKREFYGGAIGIFNSESDINSAIVIRSILSKNSELHYQAGAGIVYDSIAESELDEVHNKLRAVRKAISNTHNLFIDNI